MDVSPFDSGIVFVWATTQAKAIAKAAPYFAEEKKMQASRLVAKHTGLTAPSRYKDEIVTVNAFEQSQRVRQDFTSNRRWLVKVK